MKTKANRTEPYVNALYEAVRSMENCGITMQNIEVFFKFRKLSPRCKTFYNDVLYAIRSCATRDGVYFFYKDKTLYVDDVTAVKWKLPLRPRDSSLFSGSKWGLYRRIRHEGLGDGIICDSQIAQESFRIAVGDISQGYRM